VCVCVWALGCCPQRVHLTAVVCRVCRWFWDCRLGSGLVLPTCLLVPILTGDATTWAHPLLAPLVANATNSTLRTARITLVVVEEEQDGDGAGTLNPDLDLVRASFALCGPAVAVGTRALEHITDTSHLLCVCMCVCVWITLCHQLVRMLDRACNVTGTAALLAASVRDNRTAVVRVQRSEHVELMVQRLPGAIGVLLSHAFQGLVPAAALSTSSGVSSALICMCSHCAGACVSALSARYLATGLYGAR
jgi:hypothetical protein